MGVNISWLKSIDKTFVMCFTRHSWIFLVFGSSVVMRYFTTKLHRHALTVQHFQRMDYKQESKKLKLKLYSTIIDLRDQGYSYNQIAKELNTSPQHVNYIINKLKSGGGEAK